MSLSPSQGEQSESTNVNTGTVQEGSPSQVQDVSETLSQFKRELSTARREASESRNTVERLKEVFTGEKEAPSEDDMDEQELEFFLNKFLEAEKNGNPMPLTARLATKLIETRQGTRKQMQAVMKELEDVKRKANYATDPNVTAENQAFTNMDNYLINSLNDIDGKVDKYKYNAIANSVNDEIKRLRKEQPQAWQQIQRQPDAQKRMVEHFVRESIPPRARQIMEEDRMRNTPLTERDLLEAFEEAKKIKDPHSRAEATKLVREQLWEYKLGSRRNRN